MFRQFLKGVAVVLGAGVAAGVIVSRRVQKQPELVKIAPEDDPAFQPLLNRLDRIEDRISQAEQSQTSMVHADSVSMLQSKVDEQSKDIDALHDHAVATSHNVNGGLDTLEKRIDEVNASLPALLESIVIARSEDLRLKLRAEVQQSVHSSLTSFERAIDEKVSSRISLLEKTMLDHSEAMAELSQRIFEFDVKLQRLVSAIERVDDSNSRPLSKQAGRADNVAAIKTSAA